MGWRAQLRWGVGCRTCVAASGGLLVLQAVKVKPRRATAFVVDSYLNVRGLVGVQAGSGALAGTVLNTNDVLPREKFLCTRFAQTMAIRVAPRAAPGVYALATQAQPLPRVF